MNTISPDGAWRWNGTAWVPNHPGTAPSSGPFADEYGNPILSPLTQSDLTTASWSHYGPLAIGCVGILMMFTIVGAAIGWLAIFAFAIPLYIRANQGRRSVFVYQHATESLNFQLTWLLVSAVCVVLTLFSFGILAFVLLPLAFGASIFMIVVMAKAGLQAKRGGHYRYPLCIRFV